MWSASLLSALVRAITIMGFSHIAVPAQGLETVRVSHSPYLAIEGVACLWPTKKRQPVFVASAVDMVKRQKKRVTLATTGANDPVMVENVLLQFVTVSLVALCELVRVPLLPLTVSLCALLSLLVREITAVTRCILLASSASGFTIYGRSLTTSATQTSRPPFLVACLVVAHNYIIHHLRGLSNRTSSAQTFRFVKYGMFIQERSRAFPPPLKSGGFHA